MLHIYYITSLHVQSCKFLTKYYLTNMVVLKFKLKKFALEVCIINIIQICIYKLKIIRQRDMYRFRLHTDTDN